MARSEAKGWKARVDIAEEIVMVSHLEFACVFCGVAVGVSDKRSLPVIFEGVPGDSNVISCVSNIQQAYAC